MPERAVLVAVELKDRDHLWALDDTLSELGYLARTAGAEVVGTISQRANRYTQVYLGKGKLEELVDLANERQADVAIFDDDVAVRVVGRIKDQGKISEHVLVGYSAIAPEHVVQQLAEFREIAFSDGAEGWHKNGPQTADGRPQRKASVLGRIL